MLINIRKTSGELEPFSEEKVRSSLTRARIDKGVQDEIIRRLFSRLYEGITTRKIYSLVYGWLKDDKPYLASRYNLKRAVMALGPTGYPFEKFIAGVLVHCGFQTTVSTIIKGRCISHEIDVLAQKDNVRYMGECKFHNRQGIKTDVKVALYVDARFLDIKDTPINFFGEKTVSQALLATNTKLTSQAIAYCRCKKMQMISWNYPQGFSLRELIEKEGLHPITCLSSLSRKEKQSLLSEGFVFCHDLTEGKKWSSLVARNKLEEVKEEARLVVK